MIDPQTSYAAQLAKRARDLGTRCVHAGDERDPETGALEAPLALASAFAFESAEVAAGAFRGENDSYIYGRWSNPTVDALEAKLSAIEGAEAACATASGMAAISGAVLGVCEAGAHIVAPRSMYAESARLFRERLPRFGITTTFVDGSAVDAYEEAVAPSTRVIYIESPSNPVLALADIRALAVLARARGIFTIVDNTFATPFAQNPLDLGVDLVVHSMTKALGGHGDAIGGALLGRLGDVGRARDLIVKGFGGVLAPFNAFLISRGLRTFALRQRQACETAAELASRLASDPRIERVNHPSLPSHPQHDLARRQMHAYGSLLSFELKPNGRDTVQAGRQVIDAVKIITHAVSLGDVRSLLVHPASTTHSTMTPEARRLADVGDGLLRLSVGIEGLEDLWADLDTALAAA